MLDASWKLIVRLHIRNVWILSGIWFIRAMYELCLVCVVMLKEFHLYVTIFYDNLNLNPHGEIVSGFSFLSGGRGISLLQLRCSSFICYFRVTRQLRMLHVLINVCRTCYDMLMRIRKVKWDFFHTLSRVLVRL